MASTRARLAACALGVGIFVPAGVAGPASFTFPATAVQAEEVTYDFAYVKEYSQPQTVEFEGHEAKIYVVTKEVEGRRREFVFFGEFSMPITAQEIGGEEREGHFFLKDGAKVTTNGALATPLLWVPAASGKWDSTVFTANAELFSTQPTFMLTIGGDVREINIPAKAATLSTKDLELAVDEHWRDYTAAKSEGMIFDKASEDAYVEANKAARDLAAHVAGGNQEGVTQDILAEEREHLNKVFGELKPAPFDRAEISKAIREADAILAENGKDGKRLTFQTYRAIRDARDHAAEINETSDAETILVPKHGEPLVTHRTFATEAARLNEALAAKEIEEYVPVDVTELAAAYDVAIDRVPAEGKGFEKASRERLFEAIEGVRGVLGEPVYVQENDVKAGLAVLGDALKGLKEEPLGESFKLKVTYERPMKDAVSDLLHERFVGEDGSDLETVVDARVGQEFRLSINDQLIRRFDGFMPATFHLNSDDGAHKFVQVLTKSTGEQVVAFRAEAANVEAGGSLAIRYVVGDDVRDADGAKPGIDAEKPSGAAGESGTEAGNSGVKTGESNGVGSSEKAAESERSGPIVVKKAEATKANELAFSGAQTAGLLTMMLAMLGLGAFAVRLRSRLNR